MSSPRGAVHSKRRLRHHAPLPSITRSGQPAGRNACSCRAATAVWDIQELVTTIVHTGTRSPLSGGFVDVDSVDARNSFSWPAAWTIAKIPAFNGSGNVSQNCMSRANLESVSASAPDSAPPPSRIAVFTGKSRVVRIPPSPLNFCAVSRDESRFEAELPSFVGSRRPFCDSSLLPSSLCCAGFVEEHVSSPLAVPVRLRLLEQEDRALRHFGQAQTGRCPLGHVHQARRSFGFELLLPGVACVSRRRPTARSRWGAVHCIVRSRGRAGVVRV